MSKILIKRLALQLEQSPEQIETRLKELATQHKKDGWTYAKLTKIIVEHYRSLEKNYDLPF